MFKRLTRVFNDMRTIKALCLGAERHANAEGQQEVGLEHFVLAAIDLPDGTARKAFESVNADPDGFRSAITQQYQQALDSVGISSDAEAPDPVPAGSDAYRSRPQVGPMLEQLAKRERRDVAEPLLGAHVIAAIAATEHGVAARALKAMGIDRHALASAAKRQTG